MSTGQTGEADALVGDLITKTAMVDIEAAGDVKSYAIQLRKYEVSPGGQGAKVMSRWLIQSITAQ
jgi:phage tail tape-measure protein